MIQEGIARSPRLEWLVETHIRPIVAAVRGMVEAAQRAGLAPLGRPEHLHYMLIGAASSVYALAAEFELVTGEDPRDAALVDEHVAALERLFFRGAERRATGSARRPGAPAGSRNPEAGGRTRGRRRARRPPEDPAP
jgi:hypothetical protein